MLRFVCALFPCAKTEDVELEDKVTGNQNVRTENLHCETPVPVPVVRQVSKEIDIPPASPQNEFWWTDNPSNRASIFFETAKMADQGASKFTTFKNPHFMLNSSVHNMPKGSPQKQVTTGHSGSNGPAQSL